MDMGTTPSKVVKAQHPVKQCLCIRWTNLQAESSPYVAKWGVLRLSLTTRTGTDAESTMKHYS